MKERQTKKYIQPSQLAFWQSKAKRSILHLHFENLDKAPAPFGAADWQDNDAAGTGIGTEDSRWSWSWKFIWGLLSKRSIFQSMTEHRASERADADSEQCKSLSLGLSLRLNASKCNQN